MQYAVVLHYRVKGYAPKELARVHPTGKSPLLVTADGDGAKVLHESIAIITYLLRTYDSDHRFGRPEDWLRDETLTSYGATSLGLYATLHLLFHAAPAQVPFPIRPVFSFPLWALRSNFTGPQLDKCWVLLEAELGSRDYFMGDEPGRADFVISYPMDQMAQRGHVDLAKYPALKGWRERVLARPAWKNALAKVSASAACPERRRCSSQMANRVAVRRGRATATIGLVSIRPFEEL